MRREYGRVFPPSPSLTWNMPRCWDVRFQHATWTFTQPPRVVMMVTKENRCAQRESVSENRIPCIQYVHACRCLVYVCTALAAVSWACVAPALGMWSEAGNVLAMKACVYAGCCSRPPPARGKTDTSAASLRQEKKPFDVIVSHLCFSNHLTPVLLFHFLFHRLSVFFCLFSFFSFLKTLCTWHPLFPKIKVSSRSRPQQGFFYWLIKIRCSDSLHLFINNKKWTHIWREAVQRCRGC